MNIFNKILNYLGYGHDSVRIIGRVQARVLDSAGNVLFSKDLGKNIITNVGKAAMAALVGNTGGVAAFTYLAVGTSSTAVSASDTTLGAEIVDTGLARAAATVSLSTTTTTNDTLNLNFTWTASGSKTVQEVGIFNAVSTGTMLGHKLTGAISLASTNQLQVTYSVQYT